MEHPLSDMMTNTMSKIKDMIDVNTVVGSPITTPGGVTIIPVTKVSIGYGGGGSDDPAKAAMGYGRAWAAIGAITPSLERLFVIKKRDIQPALDYTISNTQVDAHLVTTITIGRSLALALRAGIRFLKILNERKKAV